MTGREDCPRSEGPGPGKYNLDTPENPGKLLVEKFRESRRMASKQSRYVEDVFRKSQREVRNKLLSCSLAKK